jgi:hypothetical protein
LALDERASELVAVSKILIERPDADAGALGDPGGRDTLEANGA